MRVRERRPTPFRGSSPHDRLAPGGDREKKRISPDGAGPAHRKWRSPPEGAGLALRANGMPSPAGAKMSDVPEDGTGLAGPAARKPMGGGGLHLVLSSVRS